MLKIFNLFNRKKKKDLREICREKYGNDFVELYDLLSSGVPIGNFDETIIILNMIEAARKENMK